MYQAISYDREKKDYWLRDDKQGWKNFKYNPVCYKRVEGQPIGSLPILTGGYAVPVTSFDYKDNSVLEKDIDKELVVLRDLYYKYDDVIPSYQNVIYLDIETEIGGALTAEFIRNATMPVTAIAIIDITTKQKICFILDKADKLSQSQEDDKLIIPVKSERELFLKFLDCWEELDPTICSTWNGDFFDIPYLYYRGQKVIGQDILRLSPLKRITAYSKLSNDKYGKPVDTNFVKIEGVSHLDYMLLFKKYITKQEPSYKLKDIGPKYCKLDKLEYEGNLNQLFEKDIKFFIEYNLRDVEIIEGLEKKLKFIELTILLSHICNIPYEGIYYNTVMNEGAVLKFLKRANIVSPNKPTTYNPGLRDMKESYAGGYILEPTPGIYHWVIDLDFTSLYPSIIKSLNLGIETLVGRIVTVDNYEQDNSLEKLKLRDKSEKITIERLNVKTYTLQTAEISIGGLIELIEEEEYTLAASGAFFRTDQRSVTAKILEGWFEKREHYKKLKKAAGKAEEWENYKLYDLFQHAFKILQNALYGTYAIAGWRFTDGHKICSSAITNSGQRLTKESIVFVNNKLNTELKSAKNYVCVSDTDSLYIVLEELVKHRYGDMSDDNILKAANEIQDESNKYLDGLCEKLYNIPRAKHYFQLKQEVIAKSLITTGKRRYAMHVVNKEGVTFDEIHLTGLELMKSNMNKLFKEFGENLIKNILFGKAKDDIDLDITNFYKTLKTLEPKSLGKPTGVRYISNYIKRKASSGEIFSEIKLGTPSNSKAAIRYNDLLKFKQLDKKHESIIEGDKMFIIDLKPNPYEIETIGIPGYGLPEGIEKFVKDFADIDAIFESMLLNKLKEFYKDLNWDPFPNLNARINRFLRF